MISLRKLTSGAVAAAMLAIPVAPALAHDGYGYGNRGYGGYYGYGGRGWRHHDHDVDAGDVIAGVVVIGILAAILSSAGKNKRDDHRANGNINSEDAAVDACAKAAEVQAGNKASVRDITQVDRSADGWEVEGVVEERTTWRNNGDTERRRFTCSVRYGAVQNVYIDTATVALN